LKVIAYCKAEYISQGSAATHLGCAQNL